MNKKTIWLPLLAAAFAAHAVEPAIDYSFSAPPSPDGKVKNLAGERYNGRISGTIRFAPENKAWLFNGKDSRIDIGGSEALDPLKDLTFTAVFRLRAEYRGRRPLCIFFGQNKRLLFSMRDRRMYTLIGTADGKWSSSERGLFGSQSDAVVDERFHHYAATFRHVVAPEQGMDYLELKHYLDGREIGSRRFDQVKMTPPKGPIAIGAIPGAKDFLPNVWTLAGELAAVRVFEQALSASEIENEVARFPQVKPRVGVTARKLSDTEKKLLESAGNGCRGPIGRAQFHALSNAAAAGLDWQDAAKKLAEAGKLDFGECGVYTMVGPESALTLISGNAGSKVVGWYDLRAGRELLAWDNPWFSLTMKDGDQAEVVTGNLPTVSSKLLKKPAEKDGTWEFAISYEKTPTADSQSGFTAQSSCRFYRDRIEYGLDVAKTSGPGHLAKVCVPLVRTAVYAGKDFAVIPNHAGALYENVAARGFTCNASGGYPGNFTTMAFGGYYDAKGGLYYAAEDPEMRVKNFDFSVDKKSAKVSFEWYVPFMNNDEKNEFKTTGRCAMELFRGDWYDCGLIYRRILPEIKAPWFVPDLKQVDTPEWFRHTTSWIGNFLEWQWHHKWREDLEDLRRWRQYIGLPVGIHLYSTGGKFCRDWPHHPLGPDFVERTRDLHQAGYRVIPYVNARIFETRDKRDEDYQFTKLGKPNIVIRESGEMAPENYWPYYFYVICPATEFFHRKMKDNFEKFVALGADGIYVDEIGAAFCVPCYSDKHGHPKADDRIWYLKGHRKLLDGLRKKWKKEYPDRAFVGERATDELVGICDAALTSSGSWNLSNMIPLIPLIYSGRIQFIGQAWAGKLPRINTDYSLMTVEEWMSADDSKYAFAKLAHGFLWGQQLGRFALNYLKSPRLHHLRVGVKQFSHLRLGLIDFFNFGMLDRYPKFKTPQKTAFAAIWGQIRSSDRVIKTPPIMAGSWKWEKRKAVTAVNVTNEEQKNTLLFELPRGEYRVRVFSSSGPLREFACSGGQIELPLELPPYGFVTAVAVPKSDSGAEKLYTDLEKTFEVIRQAPADPDPFAAE